jgi:hypothetical protein
LPACLAHSAMGHLRPSRCPDDDGRSAFDSGKTSIVQTARLLNALHAHAGHS